MEKNVPAERDNHRKAFFIIVAEKKRDNFESNMESQIVKTLVLTVETQNLCAFMSMIENNLIILKYILKQKQMLRIQ